MPTTPVNGVRLYWELTGGSGEPMVLVHGSLVDHHSWDAIVPSLAQSFRVLAYDRRGHSQSERPGSQGSMREDVADLAALIEELGLAPAHIVGQSLGSAIVLRLAGERPDLFRSLIVNEPPLLDLLTGGADRQAVREVYRARLASVRESLEAGDIESGLRQFVEEVVFGPGAWAQVPEEIKRAVMFNAPTFLDEMRDPEVLSLDLARLRHFSRPALLTLGEESPPYFRPILEQVAGALPQAEVQTFPGAGHEPQEDQPEAYVAAMTRFLASVAGPVHAATA